MVFRELFNTLESLAYCLARKPAFFEKYAADSDEINNREDYDIQDFVTEISEYIDCLYNETDVDTELRLMDLSDKEILDPNVDAKVNAREWLDEVESYIRERALFFEDKLDSQLENRIVEGVKLKLNHYLNSIEKLAKTTEEELYGSRIAPTPYAYVREALNMTAEERKAIQQKRMNMSFEELCDEYNLDPIFTDKGMEIEHNTKRWFVPKIKLVFTKYAILYYEFSQHTSHDGWDDDMGSQVNPDEAARMLGIPKYVIEKLWNHCKEEQLYESDKTYKAKVGGKWLSGNKLVSDEKDADTFESKTEPTQRINQMKKDGKLRKNAHISILEEGELTSMYKNKLFESILRESKEDYFSSPAFTADVHCYDNMFSDSGVQDHYDIDRIDYIAGKIEESGVYVTDSPEEFNHLKRWVISELKSMGRF